MRQIAAELRNPELGEFVSFKVLKRVGYEDVYSNIHNKSSKAYTPSVDLIFKDESKYYFTEVKTPEKQTLLRVKANIKAAIKDIKNRFDNFEKDIAYTGADIPAEDIDQLRWSGIGCVVTSFDVNISDIQIPEYITYLIVIEEKGILEEIAEEFERE